MTIVISTEDLPKAERFEFWHDLMAHTVAPVRVTSDDPAGLRVRMRMTEFGPVQVSSLLVSTCESHRTPRLIRRSAPDTFQLVLTQQGHNVVTQDRKQAVLKASDLVLYHTSRPYHVRTTADRDTAQGIMAVIPHNTLPLPLRQLERSTVSTFSGRTGIGGLLCGFLTRLTADADQYQESDGPRLGMILPHLLTALLAHRLEVERALPPETHRQTLLIKVHAFIDQNLSDPDLDPAAIAAACNVSIRTLHRLFETQNATVAEWIRVRRLERCRRDLADPSLNNRPIHSIAMRWGFPDPAQFSRAFRAAYGTSPRGYRRQVSPRPPHRSGRRGPA
jgi:AraC-like DNA-binding protein